MRGLGDNLRAHPSAARRTTKLQLVVAVLLLNERELEMRLRSLERTYYSKVA